MHTILRKRLKMDMNNSKKGVYLVLLTALVSGFSFL